MQSTGMAKIILALGPERLFTILLTVPMVPLMRLLPIVVTTRPSPLCLGPKNVSTVLKNGILFLLSRDVKRRITFPSLSTAVLRTLRLVKSASTLLSTLEWPSIKNKSRTNPLLALDLTPPQLSA